MLTTQKFWECSIGLRTLRTTVQIFPHKCLVLVTILVPNWLRINIKNSFSFKLESVSTDQVTKSIDEIGCNNSSSGYIPAKITMIAKEEIAEQITNCMNSSLSTETLPGELNIAHIVPAFEKKDQNDKTNYRPIKLLLLISKIFEKVLYQQVEDVADTTLSTKPCGFRERYSTQHALLNLLKNWQKCLNKSGVVRTVLMDFSKA